MPRIDLKTVSRFLSELRRRKVVKVSAAYAIVGWLVIQVAANTFPALHLPEWALTLVIVLAGLGFPIALVLAWILEVTPAGIRIEASSPASVSLTPPAATSPGSIPHAPIASHRIARESKLAPAREDEEPPAPDAASTRRAMVARLRHDLRTPMNAILGYSEVLATEADELDVAALLPEIQRLHGDAKKMLEHINELVPSGSEASGSDIETLRGRVRESLREPALSLIEQARTLLTKAAHSDAALADLNRVVGAASKLAVLIEESPSSPEAHADAVLSLSVERTLSRLRPRVSQPTHRDGTLLVVDDNAMNRDLLTRQLAREGYNVFTAGSGREALEKLRMHDVDLVLLDLIMPEMDGVQVLEEIQRDAALAEVPVIMISALDEIEGVARCIEKGAVDYVMKPFDPVLLRARLGSTLQIHRLRENLRHSESELSESRTYAQQLARSLLPGPLLATFERGEPCTLAEYAEVTALVVRMEGIDALASRRAGETATLVTRALGFFEERSEAAGFQLTRASDRSYTVISGAPQWNDAHADAAADFALDLRTRFRETLASALAPLQLRIGLHTGVLVTGLAGTAKLVCGLWGDSVTTADAIASHAPPGGVRLSASTCSKLGGRFALESPSVIEVAGHGHLRTHQLGERSPSTADS